MTLSAEDRQAAAEALVIAERERAPIEPLTNTWPHLDIADAYEIQQINISARCQQGAIVRGHKVGLTAKAMQEMLGVSEPDYGVLMQDMILEDEAEVAATAFCFPRAEPELAFVLREPLRGPGVEPADVLAATEYVTPAIELIDSRIRNWEIKLPDTIADNASSARVVLGRARLRPDQIDVGDIRTVLLRNGDIEATGSTQAVMDNPANAVAWLANTLSEFGTGLEPGHVIMPGSATRAVDLAAGDDVRVELDGIGSVALRMLEDRRGGLDLSQRSVPLFVDHLEHNVRRTPAELGESVPLVGTWLLTRILVVWSCRLAAQTRGFVDVSDYGSTGYQPEYGRGLG